MAKLDTPTMVEVEELTDRAATLEQQAKELGEQDQDLTQRIAECHATGGNKGKGLATLTQQRRELRYLRGDLLEALPPLRDQIAKDREAACTAEAVKRMTGISRAHGSLRQELDDDERKVHEAATVYRDAVNRVNARYKALAMLRAEAGALADRFGVAAPTFAPPVVIPALREGCREAAMTAQSVAFLNHAHVSPATEPDEFDLRTRRSYKEISGTPGFAIIKTAGSQPWAPLTEAQQKVLDGRMRDAEAEIRESKRFALEGERALQRSGMLGGAGGR